MSLIQFDQISKYFGDRLILSETTASIERGHKIGLVGPNGAGKTTLLALMVEDVYQDTGTIRRAGQCRIGYLPQRPARARELTLRHLLMQELSEIREMADTLRDLERRMASPEVYRNPGLLDEVMRRYGRLQDEFRHLGGYSYEVKMKQVICGLGFTGNDLDRSVLEFSGGEQVRAELARILLAEPDLLLLDEPTNHLDMQSTEWLEGYLRSLREAMVIVSHDRYFLDVICNRIWELDDCRLFQYPGNFSQFQKLREERMTQQEADYQAVKAEAQRLQQYIDRYKAGNRAKQAKSREKRLSRLQPISRPNGTGTIRLDLSYATHTVKQVLITEHLAVGYAGKPLVSGLNLSILRGERWGVIGPNGVGKSTLLKILVGEEPAIEGSFLWGDGVSVGYFRQGLDDLEPDNTILDELLGVRNLPVGQMRGFLARFLFTKDKVFDRISTLSGGERCRVALAKLLLARPNVLLLDEPTNHLDIVSREALEQALMDFKGTLILVTHDRYLLEKLVTDLLILEQGTYSVFSGKYSSWREKVKQEQTIAFAKENLAKEERRASVKEWDSNIRRELAGIEDVIIQMEEEQRSLMQQMADPSIYVDGGQIRGISLRHREISEELQALYQKWEGLLGELDSRNPVD